MTASTRRRIARIGIVICVACVAFAAVAVTVAPHRFGPSVLLRVDIPAIVSITAFRYYLSHGGRPS